MQALQQEWKRLQEAAPLPPTGPPSEDERVALQQHKQAVKSFWNKLDPDQRSHLETAKQAAKAKRKENSIAKSNGAARISEEEAVETVHVTICLNTNRAKQKLVEVKAQADLSELWNAAKKKLHVRGTKKLEGGAIYLVRTRMPVETTSCPLQHGDYLLVSLGEPVEFGQAQQPMLNLPKGSPDYLLVLDFEAICNETGPAPKPQEIIEFPTLLLNVQTGEVESEFHDYIRPDVHPTLSSFCTELTGIQQSTIDERGIPLAEALQRHEQWLQEHNLTPLTTHERETETNVNGVENGGGNGEETKTYLYLTCGDWDLATCLPRQLHYHNQKVEHVGFWQWLNIKNEFESFYGGKAKGMTFMLNKLGLELQGHHHSGIDDCRNIARICNVMLRQGWKPEATSTLSPKFLPW